MTKIFTFTQSLSVKLLLMMTFVFASANVSAAVNDLGALEVGKEYTIKDFQSYQATITPEKSGILVWESATAAFITVYNDEAYTQETPYKHSYIAGGQVHEYKVEAGKTYYCYTDFAWNGGTFTLYFEDELKRVKTAPEENTVFDISGEGYIELNYNLAVSVSEVTLTVGDEALGSGSAFVSGRIVGIQLKGENENELNVRGLIESGVLKGGEELVFTFKVSSVLNPALTLDETVRYICPTKPMTLVSDNSADFVLKSFWYPGDDAGKLILEFSDNLWTPTAEKQGPVVVLGFGNAESEDPGDYYYEEFYPTADGKRLICDFTQKRRRIEDMITTGNSYGSVLVKVVNVLDENGNLASSEGKGTLGTWSWNFNYEQVDCRITSEFSPKKKLHSDEKTIELWIGGYSNIRLNKNAGVLFSWADADGVEQSVMIAAAELDIEVEDGDATINVTVPDAVRQSETFKMAFVGYTVADGVDHPIEAEYQYFNVPVGINGVETSDVVSVKRYDASGAELNSPVKGLNIIQETLSDGTVRTTKVLVK